MDPIDKNDLQRRTLQAIHDNAVDAIITITERGIIETVNPATQAMFGYAPQELIGKNVNVLMPNPYRDLHDQYIQDYLKTGVAKIVGIGREVVAQRKDGSVFPMHLAVSEIRVGETRVFAGFVRDLTDLKRSEAQQASLGRIIEESLNEVFIFDPDTLRFISVNRGARENLGYSLDELKKLTPADIKPDFSLQQFKEKLQQLRAGAVEEVEFTTIHRRKDGSTYDVDVHLQLSNYLGQTVFVAIILDVSQRLLAERKIQHQQKTMQEELERLVDTRTQELRETQAELVLSEKFSTLGKVSGGIAHEIRNPLNAVKTSAYFLLNAKNPTDEKIKEHLSRIDRQVSLIDNVITALSDVAKLPEAILRPIQIESLLRDVVKATKLPSNVKVDFVLAADTPDVLADQQQIGIAFRNLIRNARDAMPAGGTISFGADVAEDQVTVTVADTGTGISAEDLKSVLEPLFTTKARGMGLGLSITRAIVEKNRGTLSVQSELGTGSVFSISLQREEHT